MRSSGSYYVTVIEDCNTNKVVGTATLFTEYKMVHNARKVSDGVHHTAGAIFVLTRLIYREDEWKTW